MDTTATIVVRYTNTTHVTQVDMDDFNGLTEDLFLSRLSALPSQHVIQEVVGEFDIDQAIERLEREEPTGLGRVEIDMREHPTANQFPAISPDIAVDKLEAAFEEECELDEEDDEYIETIDANLRHSRVHSRFQVVRS